MHNQLATAPSSIATSKSPDHSPSSYRRLRNRHLSPKPYGRQLAPIDDDNSSSDDELRAPPRIPPVIKNLSYCVKRAKSQLKPSCVNLMDLGDDCQEQDAIEYARTGAEIKFLKNLLARRSDEPAADMEAKKKRYQRQVMAFCAADSQLDRAESLARNLCQPKKDASAADNMMEGKAPSTSWSTSRPLTLSPQLNG
ncbi:hypothetical protein BDR07DRAFT_1488625 [Suillus spraguei]|nr:hypothetical protein BDR07DRAFT_1488625 [Suillus spraguei]